VEACVYFCCLQTIQNVMRHAGNTPCVVAFAWDGETFTVTVRDEGPGFDPGRTARGMGLAIVQDRADALGGRVEIQSAPGAGTGVTIRIPARARVEVDVR
jgi:signal transduction histidine kinase